MQEEYPVLAVVQSVDLHPTVAVLNSTSSNLNSTHDSKSVTTVSQASTMHTHL